MPWPIPSSDPTEQRLEPFVGFHDFPDRDAVNTVENVFLPSALVEAGTWRIRVVGFDVAGNGIRSALATPNFVLGDATPDRDLSVPCDGIPDVDSFDIIDSRDQGFALVLSGGVGGEPGPCAPIAFPGVVSVAPAPSACGLALSWPAPVGATAPVRYDLYRSDSLPVPLDAAHLVAAGLIGRVFTDDATGGLAWSYRVVATDSCTDPGPRTLANEGGDSAPTAVPALDFHGNLTASPFDCGVRLSWDPASGHGDIVYDLHRAGSSPVALDASTLVASELAGTEWLDEGWHGASVHYRVLARDLCEERPDEAGEAGPVAAADGTPPDFAGIVNTRDLGYCEVEVSWNEGSDACSGVAGYDVFRDHGVGHRGRTLVAAGVPESPFIDTTPGNGTWVYVVRAVDEAGNRDANEVFQQESENSCTNDFPADAGMDRENGVDPPNADSGGGFAPGPSEGGGWERSGGLRVQGALGRPKRDGSIRIAWNPSADEGGLYPVTYSVLRGSLRSLAGSGYSHRLATPESCGLSEHETELPSQVDGSSYYYLVVAVSGNNATFGYDHAGRERPAVELCE